MKTVRIVWPNVFSSEGIHEFDETPTLSDADAEALIACGSAVEHGGAPAGADVVPGDEADTEAAAAVSRRRKR